MRQQSRTVSTARPRAGEHELASTWRSEACWVPITILNDMRAEESEVAVGSLSRQQFHYGELKPFITLSALEPSPLTFGLSPGPTFGPRAGLSPCRLPLIPSPCVPLAACADPSRCAHARPLVSPFFPRAALSFAPVWPYAVLQEFDVLLAEITSSKRPSSSKMEKLASLGMLNIAVSPLSSSP